MDGYVFNTADGITLRQQKALASKLHSFRSSLLLIVSIALSLLVSYPLPVYADNLPVNDALNQQSVTTVSINNQGLIDLVEAAVTGLQPKQKYELVLVEHASPPYGEIQPLERFQTNPAGAAVVTTLGPIKQVVAGNSAIQRRYLAIVPTENGDRGTPVQVQLDLDSR